MNDQLIVTQDVRKEYRSGGVVIEVLKGVSLGIQEGIITAILGPSGAGKSTLLHIMGFLDRPTSGEVIFQGVRLSGLGGAEQARLRNREFGFVFQMYHLLPEFSALENTLLPLTIRHHVGGWMVSRKQARARAISLLERLGLSGRLYHRPAQLSVGERQRVAIARALVGDPKIIFCDEPTGSLDPLTSSQVLSLILSLNRELGKTFVIVTHDPDIASMADRQLHLSDGRLTDT
jgi:lipoprotein-releasing system ATP-binding protein